MGALESVILSAIVLWFAFYLVNHADITAKVRAAVLSAIPGWMASLISCALCSSFWVLAAISLFTGFTPMLFWVPPTVLFIDLAYRRLKGEGK